MQKTRRMLVIVLVVIVTLTLEAELPTAVLCDLKCFRQKKLEPVQYTGWPILDISVSAYMLSDIGQYENFC